MNEANNSLPRSWQGPDRLARELAGMSAGVTVTWLNHWSALSANWPAIAKTDAIGVDGTLLQLILRSGGLHVARSSADLVIPLYLRYRPNSRIALIGGADDVARAASERLEGVVYTANGYADLVRLRANYNTLTAHDPDVVVLGLGAGLQDEVSSEIREILPNAHIFTAGGWLDQLVVRKQYFPPLVHTLRLGWLWRVAQEPRRLVRRYTIDAAAALLRSRKLQNLFSRYTVPSGEVAFRGMKAPLPLAGTPSQRSVLQLVTQLEPAGAQSMARWAEENLAPTLHTSTVFMYDKAGSDLFTNPALLAPSRPASFRDFARFLSALWGLRGRQPDVVLAHTHYSIAAATLIWGLDKHVAVIPVHHWPTDRYPWVVRAALKIGRKIGAFAEEVYVSEELVTAGRSATVITNPVPSPGPYIESGEFTSDILTVARHAEEKSLDVLLRAMVNLPDRHLTLVGGGPLTRLLKQLSRDLGISDRVTFAGRLPNPRVRDLMRRCQVFVLPSLWEAMPVALLEAVAEDCVIVVSDISAHSFLLDKGAAKGFPAGDAEALASALLEAASDARVLREQLDGVRELYSERATSERWLNLIDSCVSS